MACFPVVVLSFLPERVVAKHKKAGPNERTGFDAKRDCA
ncbi:hypothetical protein SMB34_16205 [Thalassospira permensis NBRC 106175]|uniref:Uncharacterized protein n=1 Tax=Thalassospira permensis NBRC 106175 TaxID=1353532 RepID=A0ABR4TPC6_9PROT|nr:hypothetical protein SMB34_16205 [Thalassospira permensis NBRC 106175]